MISKLTKIDSPGEEECLSQIGPGRDSHPE